MADFPDSGSKPKALVIDDDPAVPAFLAARLGRYLEVVGVTDSSMALDTARRERPDVILCDIDMPGLKGDDVAYALSQDDATASIPLIYLTGLLPDSQPAELGDRFGGFLAVPKQAPAERLLAAIRSALGD